MIGWWMSLFQSFLLVLALSLDAFVASFAYGADRIRIPLSSLLVICGVCTGLLGLSMAVGWWIGPILPAGIAGWAGFSLLFLLGFVKLFDSGVKNFLKKHQPRQKKLHFCLAGISFLLQIYVDSTAADKDASRLLSPREAASLAFALSLDGLAVGFGAGLQEANAWEVLLFCVVLTAAAVLAGDGIGRRVAQKARFDLGWLSGLLLMLLAFLKLG